MKKKILALALVVAMLAVAIVSASLAYFTDEDYATNTFTLGEIDITLKENFGNEDEDGDGKDESKEFYPGVDVKKEVWVENTSTTANDAYIRVHVAFPVELAPRIATKDDAGKVIDYTYDITGTDGLAIVTANTTEWTWTDIYNANIGEAGNQIPCIVYVATYNTSVAANAKTTNAITAVRLNEAADTDIIKTGDPAVEHLHLFMDANKDGEWDNGELRVDTQGTNPFTVDVEVAAEAVQVEGMKAIEGNKDVKGNDKAIAADALDTAFGVPGAYELSGTDDDHPIVWNGCTAPAEGEMPSYTVAP